MGLTLAGATHPCTIAGTFEPLQPEAKRQESFQASGIDIRRVRIRDVRLQIPFDFFYM